MPSVGVTVLPEHKDQSYAGRTLPRECLRHSSDKCGSSCFCVVILVFGALVVYVLHHGRPRRLLHGVDHAGRVCGYDDGVFDKPYMYWCGAGEWDNELGTSYPHDVSLSHKACIATCPTAKEPQDIPCLQRNHQSIVERADFHETTGVHVARELLLNITQLVSLQRSYPTYLHGGKCLPHQWELRTRIMANTLGTGVKAAKSIGSIVDAWWLLLPISAIGIILGYVWMFLLQDFAGLVIFCQMVGTVAMCFVLGIYFLTAIFFPIYDPFNPYQQINPFYHAFSVFMAQFLSVCMGIFLLIVTISMIVITSLEAVHIDENIGLVSAAMDCVFTRARDGKGSGDLTWLPLINSMIMTGVMTLLLYFFAFMRSMGSVDNSMISYNGESIVGLYKRLQFTEWWSPHIFFFVCAVWFVELVVSLSQYTCAHVVSCWYFTPVRGDRGGKNIDPLGAGEHVMRHVTVRVAGLDTINDPRPGVLVTDDHNHKILHVYQGHHVPGDRHIMPMTRSCWWKSFAESPEGRPQRFLCEAYVAALFYHWGSLTKGSLYILFTRPFRMLQAVLVATMVRESGNRGNTAGPIMETMSAKGAWKSHKKKCYDFFGLLATFLDAIFGKYSKDAYIEVARSGHCYYKSARHVEEVTGSAGGVVCFFMGSCSLFELVWTVFIVVFAYIITILVLLIPCFSDPTSRFYVEDPGCIACISAILNGYIGYMFSLVISHTADTLIYSFANHREHIKTFTDAERKHEITRFLPCTLEDVIGQNEVVWRPAHHLKAKGTRVDHFYYHGKHLFEGILGWGHHGGHDQGPHHGHDGNNGHVHAN